MGTFNRSMKAEHRHAMASGLARFLEVQAELPTDFGALPVPLLHPQNSWYFDYARNRGEGDIDSLWEAFSCAQTFSASPDAPGIREDFIAAYDAATQVRSVSWAMLSMGLYMARPRVFPSLDKKGRAYLERLHVSLPKVVNGEAYVATIDRLKDLFGRDDCPVHSFPEMCAEAWLWSAKHGEESGPLPPHDPGPHTSGADKLAEPRTEPLADVYGVDDIADDGCFLERPVVESLLERLRSKEEPDPPGSARHGQDLARSTARLRARRSEGAEPRSGGSVPPEPLLRGLRARLPSSTLHSAAVSPSRNSNRNSEPDGWSGSSNTATWTGSSPKTPRAASLR